LLKGHEIQSHTPYLNTYGIEQADFDFNEQDIAEVASLILAGEIIGVCNGFGEAGPRALGNRSLIGRPDSIELRKRLSEDVKRREWYRPVAPMMLASQAKIVTGWENMPQISRYMLIDFPILPAYHDELKGVLHFNHTSRIQAIDNRSFNPYIHDLLSSLWDQAGMRGLMNTSFNIKGEPIVHSKADAMRSAQKMNLKFLVLDGKLTQVQ